MSFITRLLNVFRPNALERELDDEVRFHLEERAALNVQRGMSAPEAESAARQQFGEIDRVKDQMREVRMVNRKLAWLGRNALAVAIFAVLFVGAPGLRKIVHAGWPFREIGLIMCCVVAVFVALRLRARVVACFLVAMAAAWTSELGFHLFYGLQSVQPIHLVVMGAGVLGVAFGSVLSRYGHGSGSKSAETAVGAPAPVRVTPRFWTLRTRVAGLSVFVLAVGLVAASLMWDRTPFSTNAEQPNPLFYRVGDQGISNPVLIHQVFPKYTPEALREKITGTVIMECIVVTTGACVDVRVTHSLDPDLDRGAVTALQQSRFSPGRRSDKPVPVLITMETRFTLR